jgi:hypothetical protein
MSSRYPPRDITMGRDDPRRLGPPGPRPGPSPLDRFVDQFHDRWETNSQYRSMVSGALAATGLLLLCVVVAVAATVANASMGGGASAGTRGVAVGGNPNLSGLPRFPTATVPGWTPGNVPAAAPAPMSQTPPPQPSQPPTPTPQDLGTPGGGGLPTTCNGSSGRDTWALDPCPQLAGQSGTMTINAPGHAGAPINVILNFGVCANNASCTLLFTPTQYALDGKSSITLSYTVPAAAANNTAPISGMIEITNGPSFSFTAAPVQ